MAHADWWKAVHDHLHVSMYHIVITNLTSYKSVSNILPLISPYILICFCMHHYLQYHISTVKCRSICLYIIFDFSIILYILLMWMHKLTSIVKIISKITEPTEKHSQLCHILSIFLQSPLCKLAEVKCALLVHICIRKTYNLYSADNCIFSSN